MIKIYVTRMLAEDMKPVQCVMGDPFIHQGFLPAEESITFKFAFVTYLPDICQDIWHVSLAYIPAAGYMDIPGVTINGWMMPPISVCPVILDSFALDMMICI